MSMSNPLGAGGHMPQSINWWLPGQGSGTHCTVARQTKLQTSQDEIGNISMGMILLRLGLSAIHQALLGSS